MKRMIVWGPIFYLTLYGDPSIELGFYFFKLFFKKLMSILKLKLSAIKNLKLKNKTGKKSRHL